MVRKAILAGAMLALGMGIGPAVAQVALSPFNAPSKRPMTLEEIEKKKAADAAYKAAMEKIPEKKGAADPWGNVREAPSGGSIAAKDTTKPSKTKPQQ
jgi:hypothetical protein